MVTFKTSEELPPGKHNEDRMRRARSWLARSRRIAPDETRTDGERAGLHCERFIFLWIAFNAAYGRELSDDDGSYESEKFSDFLQVLLEQDMQGDIGTILWETYSGPIRILLDNHYVYRPFWDWVRGSEQGKGWDKKFEEHKRSVHRNLTRRDVHGVLMEVFRRLYVLRNQIFHGGATYASGWGWEQVRDGSRIMAVLVPKILDIMQADIEADPGSVAWGRVMYPRINDDRNLPGH